MKLPSLFAVLLGAFIVTGVQAAEAQVFSTPLKKGAILVTQGSSLTAPVKRAALQRTTLLLPIVTVPPSTPKMFSPSPQKAPLVCPDPAERQDRFSLARKQEFLFNTIQAGYMDPHYHTDGGEDFFPYTQACARAQVEGDNEMLGWLQKLRDAKKSVIFRRACSPVRTKQLTAGTEVRGDFPHSLVYERHHSYDVPGVQLGRNALA